MKNSNHIENNRNTLISSFSFLAMGLFCFYLGVTWLPIIGIVAGIPFIIFGIQPWIEESEVHTVNILVDSPTLNRGSSIIPVTLLTTQSEDGKVISFDASSIDPSSIRLGPNMIKPIDSISDSHIAAQHMRDADGDGNNDLVLYFLVGKTDIPAGIQDICISGETVKGEMVRGCTTRAAMNA
jgi:hypothetical protein